MAKVLRWEIPVDGTEVKLSFKGFVTSQFNLTRPAGKDMVEFWTFDPGMRDGLGGEPTQMRDHYYRVYPSDVEVPAGYWCVGSTSKLSNNMVYHVFERLV